MTDHSYTPTLFSSVRQLVYTSLMAALVFVVTFAIRIPISFTGGYVNIGDSMVLLSGMLLGPLYGALAAGIGAALSDLIGGYTFWVLPTFIIKATMAAFVGYMFRKNHIHALRFSVILGLLWMIFVSGLFYILNLMHAGSTLFETTLNVWGQDASEQFLASDLIHQIESISPSLILSLLSVPLLLVVLGLAHRFTKKITLPMNLLLSFIASGLWMVFGYYVAYILLTQNAIVPIFSVPGNVAQAAAGILIASFLAPIFKPLAQHFNN